MLSCDFHSVSRSPYFSLKMFEYVNMYGIADKMHPS